MESKDYSFEDFDNYLDRQVTPIVHQIWFGTIPNPIAAKAEYKKLKQYRDSWTLHNPHLVHVVWNKSHCLELLKTHYAEYVDLFTSYPYEIQRCDAIRYFILHRYGGIYADMDYRCIKSFEPLFKTWNKDVYFVQTPNLGGPSNSLMVSKKNALFWKRCFIELDRVRERNSMFGKHVVVMYTTGPHFLYTCYEQYKYRFRIGMLPFEKFHPTGLSKSVIDDEQKEEIYSMHLGHGSWEETDSKILIILYLAWPMIVLTLALLVPHIFIRY